MLALGGYIGFFDLQTQSQVTYAAPNDKKAQERIKIKSNSKAGRGYLRKRGNPTLVKEDEHESTKRSSE